MIWANRADHWNFLLDFSGIWPLIKPLLTGEILERLTCLYKLMQLPFGLYFTVDNFGRLQLKHDETQYVMRRSNADIISMLKEHPWMLGVHHFVRGGDAVYLTIEIPNKVLTEIRVFSLIHSLLTSNPENCITDEYDRKYTYDEFIDIALAEGTYANYVDYATIILNRESERSDIKKEMIRADKNFHLWYAGDFAMDFLVGRLRIF